MSGGELGAAARAAHVVRAGECGGGLVHSAARALLVALATLGFTDAVARASPIEAPRWSLTLEVRGELGEGEVAGLALGLASLGVRWRLAPALALDAGLVGLVPSGPTDDGRASNGGLGGELGMRLLPWPDAAVRPWLRTSIGLLFFSREARFLPGGDVYEGIVTWGFGADVALGRASLGLELHYVHLSNGQGIGPHNPAYDGLGGSLSLTFALDVPGPIVGAWDEVAARAAGRERTLPGVELGAGVGRVDDATLVTTRLRIAQRLTPHALVLLDAEAGSLASEPYVEAGLALVAHVAPVSAGFHVGYRDYVGLGTLVATAQVEVHASDEVSLLAMGHIEDSALFGTHYRAAVGLRAYPSRAVAIDLGVGFDHIGDLGLLDDASDPYLGIAWQLPLDLEDWQVVLALERQVSTIDFIGIRVGWGTGPTPRDLARHDGWQRLR